MSLHFTATILLTLVLAMGLVTVQGKGFLADHKGSFRKVNAKSFDADVRTAMGEALGCGGHVTEEKMKEIERALEPMWRTMPKNSYGRIERRSLRYLAHRYFTQKSSIWIRGFEPTRPVNHSAWGTQDILSQKVPAFVESVLESNHATVKGFDLQDAVQMVATLSELIFDSEGALLETVYQHQAKDASRSMSKAGMSQVLQEFIVRWMMGDDLESVKALLGDRKLLAEHIPHWDKLTGLAEGQISALDFQRRREPAKMSRPGHNAMSPRYSFEDAHQLVGGISGSFASFWESECADMKSSLVKMDPLNTGRVPLSKFYGTGLDSEWRFGESEAYLRDLGALDETSSRGKQVIIPNYIQGASNCIISSEHYLVCCVSECESMLGQIERAIGSPLALVSELLPLVANMTSQTTVDHDEPPRLEGQLSAQLEQIAATHGGKVPLHGRLFAQWLHYAFPHECMFPHMSGTASSATPSEFGDNYMASKSEMKMHARDLDSSTEELSTEETEWMSQWSEEEELIASYTELHESWLSKQLLPLSGAVILVLGLFGVLSLSRGRRGSEGPLLPMDGKSHFV